MAYEQDEEILDPYEDFSDMRPEECLIPVGRKPKAVAIGVPLDMSKHPGLYARKWPEPPKPYVLPPAVEPRVRMADPPEGKVPDEAQKLADALSGAGFTVRLTYGVCGHDHRDPERGKCAACSVIAVRNAEGGMPKHTNPEKVCPGGGSDPTRIFEFEEKGKTKRQGICPICDEPVRLTKTDKIYKHGPTCEGTGAYPEKIIPGKPLPPEESLAVRVKGFGAACWVDGKYDEGGVIENGRIIRMGIQEWKRRVKAAVAAGAASA